MRSSILIGFYYSILFLISSDYIFIWIQDSSLANGRVHRIHRKGCHAQEAAADALIISSSHFLLAISDASCYAVLKALPIL